MSLIQGNITIRKMRSLATVHLSSDTIVAKQGTEDPYTPGFNSYIVSIQVIEDNSFIPYGTWSASSLPVEEDNYIVANKLSWKSNVSSDGTTFNYVLSLTKDTAVNMSIPFTVTYKDITYNKNIQFVTVADGVSSDTDSTENTFIKLDLDNENDTFIYDNDGYLKSGEVLAQGTLYVNGIPQTQDVTWYHTQNNVGTSNIVRTDNVLVVKGMTGTSGYVTLKAEYNGVIYAAVLSLKKIVNASKYQIVPSYRNISHNVNTLPESKLITFDIYRTDSNGNIDVLTSVPSGYNLTYRFDNSDELPVSEMSLLWSTESNHHDYKNIFITLRDSSGSYVDSENIPIISYKDGNGINSINRYYVTSDTTNKSEIINIDTWYYDSPAVTEDKPYLWEKIVTSYTDGRSDTIDYALIGKMGDRGIDGTKIEYIYCLTQTNSAPALPSTNNPINTNVIGEWCDEPQTLTIEYPYQWISEHQYANNVWGVYTQPALWNTLGKDSTTYEIVPTNAYYIVDSNKTTNNIQGVIEGYLYKIAGDIRVPVVNAEVVFGYGNTINTLGATTTTDKNGFFSTGTGYDMWFIDTWDDVSTDAAVLQSNYITAIYKIEGKPVACLNVGMSQSGINGSKGDKGAPMRITEWAEGWTYYSGKNNSDPFSDVVIYDNRYYYCNVNHVSSDSNNPGSNNSFWKQSEAFDMIATKLFLAQKTYIQNLVAEIIQTATSGPRLLAEDNYIQFYGNGEFPAITLGLDSQGRGALIFHDESTGVPVAEITPEGINNLTGSSVLVRETITLNTTYRIVGSTKNQDSEDSDWANYIDSIFSGDTSYTPMYYYTAASENLIIYAGLYADSYDAAVNGDKKYFAFKPSETEKITTDGFNAPFTGYVVDKSRKYNTHVGTIGNYSTSNGIDYYIPEDYNEDEYAGIEVDWSINYNTEGYSSGAYNNPVLSMQVIRFENGVVTEYKTIYTNKNK